FPIDVVDVAWGGTYTDPNLVLETHHYYDESSDQLFNDLVSGTANYESKQEIENGLQVLIDQPEREGRPLYIGEFGAYWETDQKGIRWTQDIVDVLNSHRVNWTYYTYKSQRCTSKTSSTPDCAGPKTLALYVPTERSIMQSTPTEVADYMQHGF